METNSQNMKKSILIFLAALLALVALAYWLIHRQTESPPSGNLETVTINEAVRTVLYVPLYHAKEKGYFEDEGLDVQIVTGGTATNSFAAMLNGDADFSQADPMYVPIANEKGGKTAVVAQVVGRIAVWGLTLDEKIEKLDAESLRGKKISTHPRPMTAYTYTVKTINDAGLSPDEDVEIIQGKPGSEIAALFNNDADYMLTLEPNTSIAEQRGAKVVLSYPDKLGDQIFTALMGREDYIRKNPDVVKAVVRSYQRALDDIYANPSGAVDSVAKYFPQVDRKVLARAIERLIDDKVVPRSVEVSDESWDKAISVRLEVGDLKSPVMRASACTLDLTREAISE